MKFYHEYKEELKEIKRKLSKLEKESKKEKKSELIQKKVREQHIELGEDKIEELKVKWDDDMDVTLPTLLFDDTNLLSIDSFCVSVDEQEHKDSIFRGCCSRLALIGEFTLCSNFYIFKFFSFKAFLCT